MPSFAYVAKDSRGQVQRGSAEGASAGEVTTSLRGRGLLVLKVELAGSGAGLSLPAILPARSIDVEVGLKQLAVMLRNGVSLLAALRILPEQSRRRAMSNTWSEVARRIQSGVSLGDALAEHRCFSSLVVHLVRVGEQSGNLEQVLRRSAEALERRRVLKMGVLTAFMYPTIVLLMTFGVTAFLVVSVLPKIQIFLKALGKKLPPMTQLLLDFSAAIQTHVVLATILSFTTIGALILLYLWPPGRLTIDRILLRVPIVGRVLRLSATIQLGRNLGDLLRSGVTLLESLRTTEGLLGNRYLSEVVANARDRVLGGSTLEEPLKQGGGFSPMLAAMVAVGEASGSLDEVLEEVALFHEEELQGLIRILGTLIEPVVIVLVGAIVGFVYLSVFMALYAAQGG